MTVIVFLLVLGLAAANGANDIPKGVATLAAAGVTKIRTALIWGTIATVAGCLTSLTFASKLTELFSKGIVSAKPTPEFAIAVLVGSAAWVALATIRRLPVSTTHALVGALLGAGTVLSAKSVHWNVLAIKVAQPMLLSVLIAFVISALFAIVWQRLVLRSLIRRATAPAPTTPSLVGAGGVATATAPETDPAPSPAPDAQPAVRLGVVGALHWLTAGLTSFARGLNDTPKIVAIGSFALISGMTAQTLLFTVTAAMAIGGLAAGSRIAKCMCCCVVKMPHVEGFMANLTTATLVGLGALRGLPMSTTHVSVGAIAGTAGTDVSRLQTKTLRDFAMAWLVTPPFAAAVAAGTLLLIG